VKTSCHFSAGKKAFTLIELTVVAAVVLVLSILLISASGSALQAVYKAVCMNNLRMLWQAHNAYCGDHGGQFVPYADSSNTIWPELLRQMGYLDSVCPYFYCPAFQRASTDLKSAYRISVVSPGNSAAQSGAYMHYGYNYRNIGSSQHSGDGSQNPAFVSQIAHPSKTVLMMDTVWHNSSLNRGYYLLPDASGEVSGTYPDPRHNGHVNAIFVDGHTESITVTDSTNPWNSPPAGLGNFVNNPSFWKR